MITPSKTASIQPARFFGQHDWDAGTDGIGELGRARDQFLLLRIVFERPLGQRAEKYFRELGIDAAGRTLGGRGRHDALRVYIPIARATLSGGGKGGGVPGR